MKVRIEITTNEGMIVALTSDACVPIIWTPQYPIVAENGIDLLRGWEYVPLVETIQGKRETP